MSAVTVSASAGLKPPAITVVIPLYQTERYIAETLRSVLDQSFKDFEVLVIDDGSSDRGPEIARGFADPRVRVITQANRGLAGARNTGIRLAAAPLIAFLDADDRWQPEKLSRHADQLATNPLVGVSFSHSRLIDDAGRPLGLVQRPAGRAFTADEHFCNNPIGNGSSPVIRRAVFDAIGFHDASVDRVCWFDESFRQSEDVECWVRIAATTPWQFACIDAALTDYRVNSSGLSSNTDKQLATWLRFRAKLKTYAPELEARAGGRAEAYQYRTFARRAVRSGDGRAALRLMTKALRLHPAMLREEPARSSVTVLAALSACVLPQPVFDRVQRKAVALLGASPKLRV
jgi:glycosyltransferase involved in cell wall biosynthesis